jgi:hypothetical protein
LTEPRAELQEVLQIHEAVTVGVSDELLAVEPAIA